MGKLSTEISKWETYPLVMAPILRTGSAGPSDLPGKTIVFFMGFELPCLITGWYLHDFTISTGKIVGCPGW